MEERVYPRQPIVGVGAVVVDNNRVLLVKRGHKPCAGCWSVPGGVQRVGESLGDAVLRELREETSVEGRIEGIIWVDEAIVCDSRGAIEYHYVIIDFLVKPLTTTIKPGSDAVDARWFPLDMDWERIRTTRTTARLLEHIRRHGIRVLPYNTPAITVDKGSR